MKIDYCLPITKEKKSDVINVINTNLTQYSFFEVWLDYIEDLDTQFIQKIIEMQKNKLIFLFRRQRLENMHMPLLQRKEIIRLLAGKNAFLDLDITTQKEELSYIKENNLPLSLITSFHDYDTTPGNEKLQEIITTMTTYNPKIYKIATYCKTPQDTIQLLSLLLQLKEQHIRCIMLGMGKHGAITRIFGPLWGNEMVFAPVEKKDETAPNMLTKKQLETIFSELGV